MTTTASPSVFDFGEFTPRTLGVALNLPEELGSHLLEMASFILADDLEEDRYDHLRDILQKDQDQSAEFITLSCGSALIHELKHFHDYLSSPFGCAIIREHLLLILQFFSVKECLRPESVLGIPLQQWRDLSDVRYSMYARSSTPRFGRFPLGAAQITEHADGIIRKIQSWHRNPPFMPGFAISTRHLVEAAAVEVQTTKITESFGPKYASSFGAHLRSREDGGTYTALSEIWQRISDALASEIPASVKNALLFYSLCGKAAADPDSEEAHPVSRFLLLLEGIHEKGEVPAEAEVLAFLDTCAEKYGWPNLCESLEESSWANRQYALALREIVRSSEGNDEANFPELLFTAYDSWIAAHQFMVSAIAQNPMQYFDPSRYLQCRGSWVAAPIYVSTTSPNLFVEGRPLLDALMRRGWEPVWGVGGEVPHAWAMLYGPDLTPGVPTLSRQHAMGLSSLIWPCYALWSRGILNPIARSVAVHMLESLFPTDPGVPPKIVLSL